MARVCLFVQIHDHFFKAVSIQSFHQRAFRPINAQHHTPQDALIYFTCMASIPNAPRLAELLKILHLHSYREHTYKQEKQQPPKKKANDDDQCMHLRMIENALGYYYCKW